MKTLKLLLCLAACLFSTSCQKSPAQKTAARETLKAAIVQRATTKDKASLSSATQADGVDYAAAREKVDRLEDGVRKEFGSDAEAIIKRAREDGEAEGNIAVIDQVLARSRAITR